jgi:hypothetical protein
MSIRTAPAPPRPHAGPAVHADPRDQRHPRRLAPTVPPRAKCVRNAQPITTRSSSPGQFDTDADEDTVPDVIML